MHKDGQSTMGYIGYGVLFIVELTMTPYYICEEAYYRAQNRMKKFYR
jgi:hypothetical protein